MKRIDQDPSPQSENFTSKRSQRWSQTILVRLTSITLTAASLALACSNPEPEVLPITKVVSSPVPPESPTPIAVLRPPKSPSPTIENPLAEMQRVTREPAWATATSVAATRQATLTPAKN